MTGSLHPVASLKFFQFNGQVRLTFNPKRLNDAKIAISLDHT